MKSRPDSPPLLRRLFPTWPVPTPALWLTGMACVGCVLALWFQDDLWTNPTASSQGLWVGLCGLLLVGLWQTLRLLWRWLAAYPGPRWMALLLRLGLLAVTVGAGLLAIALLGLAGYTLMHTRQYF